MESHHKEIAVDTNVLLEISKKKIDVLEEAKEFFGAQTIFVVPEQEMTELDFLSKKGKTMKKQCLIARKILESHNAIVRKIEASDADTALVEMAKSGTIVMTSDKVLKRRVKKALGEIIELSKGHILQQDF